MSLIKDVVNELTDPLLAIPLAFTVCLGGLFLAAADISFEEDKAGRVADAVAVPAESVTVLKL